MGIKSAMSAADICPTEERIAAGLRINQETAGLTSSGTAVRVTAVQRFPRSTLIRRDAVTG